MAILKFLNLWMAILRQRSFYPEFRIPVENMERQSDILVNAYSSLNALHQETSLKVIVLENELQEAHAQIKKTKKNTSSALNNDFIISLCNDQFRLKRNAEILISNGSDSKELRNVHRVIENIDYLLEEYSVEYVDLTDQEYKLGQSNFELLAEPEDDASLDIMKILRCECPVILLNGKLIQKARGIVARPA